MIAIPSAGKWKRIWMNFIHLFSNQNRDFFFTEIELPGRLRLACTDEAIERSSCFFVSHSKTKNRAKLTIFWSRLSCLVNEGAKSCAPMCRWCSYKVILKLKPLIFSPQTVRKWAERKRRRKWLRLGSRVEYYIIGWARAIRITHKP